jgi:flavodoxin
MKTEIDIIECHSLVLEFHTKFRFKKQTAEQRFAILNEELNEFWNATNDIDRLDGLVDSLYVELGTWINFGKDINDFDYSFYEIHNKFSDFMGAFREVHRSNMSKSCKDLETVHKTIANRENMTYELVDGMYFIKDENQKLIKSCDYSPANLETYI